MSINPYQSPTSSLDAPLDDSPDEAPGFARPYASAETRAKWTKIMLAAGCLCSLVSVGLSLREMSLLAQIDAAVDENHARILQATYDENDRYFLGLTAPTVVASLGTIIAFLMWIHRVTRNLPALGATRLRFTPQAAVWWWFCPLLNMWKPCQAVKDAWSGSDPSNPPTMNLALRQYRRWSRAHLIGW